MILESYYDLDNLRSCMLARRRHHSDDHPLPADQSCQKPITRPAGSDEGFIVKDSSEVAFNLQAELAASKARETALLGSIETANSDLAALREDLAEYQKILTSYKNNYVTKLAYNAVQSSLTAAEHRNAELVELLREAACAVKVHAMTAWAVPLYMRISKALTKPTESGASE